MKSLRKDLYETSLPNFFQSSNEEYLYSQIFMISTETLLRVLVLCHTKLGFTSITNKSNVCLLILK